MKILKKLNRFLAFSFIYLLPRKHSSWVHRKFYGVTIGKNVRFTGMPNWGSEPFLISIGNNVTITQNVSFLTHDGGLWVLRSKFPGLNYFGRISIGNNVFIGAGSKILYDVSIGDNVVIAAGSLVTKSIPSNSICAGVPARVIKSVEDYEKNIFSKNYIILKQLKSKKRKESILNHLNNAGNCTI